MVKIVRKDIVPLCPYCEKKVEELVQVSRGIFAINRVLCCPHSIPVEVTKEVLNIPDRYARVCITPIGVPETWPETPTKRDLEEFLVFDRF